MTTTQNPTATAGLTSVRLAAMSTDDLRSFIAYKDYWMASAEKQARTDRHAEMCAAELARRGEAA